MRSTIILLFLTVSLAGGPSRAAAQTAPPRSPLRGDTATAVRRLFAQHRSGGLAWTIIGGAFTGTILGASAGEGFNNAGGTIVGIAVLGGVPAGIGIGKLTRFSQAREQAVVADFQQRHQLPAYVRKRLKARYFQQPQAVAGAPAAD